jgi:hypothetical protein
MTIITTLIEKKFVAPALPVPPRDYDQRYSTDLIRVLRIYFNQLDDLLTQVVGNLDAMGLTATSFDAFGRLRTAEPYTLFDSQNRYQKDPQFSEALTGSATTTYVSAESSVDLNTTTLSGDKAVRQTFRVFPYQPGKSLMVLATFVMNAVKTNLRQRVGYFNDDNGVFFQVNGALKSFVLRTNTSGSPSDARTVNQADWNGDKLDGTGLSGIVLDVSKAQILYMDFEWLGVGSVRCGFVIDGTFIVCHTFNNANDIDKVYMRTAILPVRYEVENIGVTASSSTLTQICSSVVSEGGYEATSIEHVARRTTVLGTINTAANFLPVVSIRLASTALGAVVLPNRLQFQPTTLQNYEIALIKNPVLTGATWAATVPSDANVEFDVAATAIATAGTIVQTGYVASSGGGGQADTTAPTGFNWDQQLGVSLTNVSDIYTLGVRTISGATTGDGVGSITFYDLTQ